jgi:hypothetical protein
MKADEWKDHLVAALRATEKAPTSRTEEMLVSTVLEKIVNEMHRWKYSLSTAGHQNISVYGFDDRSALIWAVDKDTGDWSVHISTIDALKTGEGLNALVARWKTQ